MQAGCDSWLAEQRLRGSLAAIEPATASCNSTLWRPCAHCPFRSDRPFGVRRARCEKIPTALFGRDLTFTCHETTEQPVPQHYPRIDPAREARATELAHPVRGHARPALSAPLASRRAGRELRTRSSILFQVTSTPLTNQRTNGGETSI